MMRFLPLLVGIAAVSASAYDSGRQSGRWQKLDDLTTVAARVNNVPLEVGDWRSEKRDIDAHQLEVAGVVGHFSRLYINRKTGEQVQILLICGRPPAISVHEPDVCYASAGYVQSKDLEKVALGSDEFKVGKFVKGPPQADALRIQWGWTTDGQWKAPDNARRAFGRGTNALFKMYVIRQIGPEDGSATKEPATSFLDVMLPELKRCLAPAT
jgi:hypothetical protein